MESDPRNEYWYRHYHYLTLAPPTAAVFVHDFVRVDLPLDAVVGAFTYFVSPELLGDLVCEAWLSELAEAGRVLRTGDHAEADLSVKVQLSPGRPRLGSLVVPISWHTGSKQWIPPLQADLEITSFGPDRTHIHVMGMSDLAPGTMAGTDRASLDHRLSVALVRQVLVSLAELLISRLDPGAEVATRQ